MVAGMASSGLPVSKSVVKACLVVSAFCGSIPPECSRQLDSRFIGRPLSTSFMAVKILLFRIVRRSGMQTMRTASSLHHSGRYEALSLANVASPSGVTKVRWWSFRSFGNRESVEEGGQLSGKVRVFCRQQIDLRVDFDRPSSDGIFQ